jgi:hydroxyacylglutathione hydrolase
MGWYLNYEEYFVLVAEKEQVEDLTRKLMRIGLDNIHGYLTPGQLKEIVGANLGNLYCHR